MRMRPRSALLSLLALGLAGALTGGLGGCQVAPIAAPESTTSPSDVDISPLESSTPPPPRVRPSCALASAAVVRSTLNITVGEPQESFSGTEIDCTYPPGPNGTVILTFFTEQDADTFASLRREADTRGEPTRDVPDLGDEAYVTTVEFDQTVSHTVVARKGSVVVSVSAPGTLDALRAFAGQILTAL